MNCIGPWTPEDFELLAYADGEASPEAATHISSCPACRRRVEELGRELEIWQTVLHRAGCPSTLELGEYYARILPPARAAGIGEHLKHCRACASEVAMIRNFLASAENARVGGSVAERVARGSAALRTVKARLSGLSAAFGTGSAPALLAVRETRGPYLGDTKPITLDAEDFLITLDFLPEPSGETRRLVGMVAGPDDFAGAEVEVLGEDAPRVAQVDDLGSFSFDEISPGAHSLLVRLPASGIQVEIDSFTVN